MSVDFNSEHKEEQAPFFQEGVHVVNIVDVEGGTNENGKEFIKFTVEGSEGQVGEASMWFTTDKAIKFTFSTIRSLFTHNATKGKEEAAKEMINAVKNSDELVALCKKVLMGKEAWFQVEKSDYTYTNQAGEQKQGYNRNIFGYEPKPKKSGVDAVDSTFGGGEVLNDGEIPAGL